MQPQIDLHTVEREPGTDARILSWNILSEELTPDAPAIDRRIDGICEVILQYLPDAAGIQEISETAYALFADRTPPARQGLPLCTKRHKKKQGARFAVLPAKQKQLTYCVTSVMRERPRMSRKVLADISAPHDHLTNL